MMPTPEDPRPTRPPVVPPYTRADAITDGLLIEVPDKLARTFRFSYPVAITQTAWHDTVAWDTRAEARKPRPTGQCETGRITEVLWAARQAAAGNPTGTHDIAFVVHRVPPHGPLTRALRATLVLHIHRGDHGETVATIGPRHTQHAGRFHLAGDPATVWFAAAFDTDSSGRTHPVVTADTLDAVLAHASDTTGTTGTGGIDVTPGTDGDVHVHQPGGITHTLRPDPLGRYHLRPLDWPLVCRASEF